MPRYAVHFAIRTHPALDVYVTTPALGDVESLAERIGQALGYTTWVVELDRTPTCREKVCDDNS
jgi:hypothetical protein